ncbi:MAG: DUF389 domain-containing protein [Flavobacterium sp.]|nr:DUF389 domain-containing protein [Flavobacterium sp.]
MGNKTNKILDIIDLHQGEEDKKKVLDNVLVNITFRGSNLWILACAIVIASVGLNVNSTAVIIGAMLISPLMGPIVGAGFALGTYDFDLLKKSLKNLAIATGVGLFFSALYFFISPFKDTQSELLARTAPNIYDVMIAFFGGLVGVIAITRVEKGNPIPGVAIATALMPPLCTAGYGLAIANWKFFAGAIYLYTINCFFICIATFFIIKYLKYPVKQFVDTRYQKRIRTFITALIFLMIIPSFYLAYQLLDERQYNQKVERFITEEFTNKGYIIIYKKTDFNAKDKTVEVALFNKRFDDEELKDVNDKLKFYQLANTRLVVRQDTTNLKRDIMNEIGYQNNRLLTEKELALNRLMAEVEKSKFDDAKILGEAKILFPDISDLSLAKHTFNTKVDSLRDVTVVVYKSNSPLNQENSRRFSAWLRQKLEIKNLDIYYKPN